MVLIQNMDFENCGIDSGSRNLLDVDQHKNNESIITFSPDRTRFGTVAAGQNHKSRNASIPSDFDLQVTYSATDIKVNQFENQPPSTSFTDLLSSSPSPLHHPLPLSQLNLSSSGRGDVDIINKLSLDLKQDLNLSVSHNQSQQCVRNGNIGGSSGSSMSTSTLTTTTTTPTPTGKGITGIMSTSQCNGTGQGKETTTSISPNSSSTSLVTSTVQLQKKLERKIAQASAIAAAMNSMSPKDESEFGEWNIGTREIPANSNSSPTLKSNSSEQIITNSSSTSTDPSSASKSLSKSKSSKTKNTVKTRYSSAEDRKPACVKFQEDEVEIISKSSRSKVVGGLIPPERLAVPNKSLPTMNNMNNNRRHPSTSGSGGGSSARSGLKTRDEQEHSSHKIKLDEGETPNTGTTSEVKPLVEWDSDDSEEELSFFPTGKPKAKLTDNLSIDNLSLSGEEDDLHLSPPRHMSHQKCPCDPRKWISDHVTKLPKSSNSFPGQDGQCKIT